MKLRLPALVSCVLLLLAACAGGRSGTYKDELVAADKAFSALSAKEGPKAAFLATLAPDAKLLGQYETGAAGIRSTYMQLPDNVKLSWEPAFVDTSPIGELGYTWGRYTLTLPALATNKFRTWVQHGNYVTIWKRDPLGRWKVVFIGNTPDRG